MRGLYDTVVSKELLKMSDTNCIEKVKFDNVIGEIMIGKLILNRVINIAYKNLIKSEEVQLGEYEDVLKLLYQENIRKARLCKDEIIYVCKIFEKADFQYAFLKGAYLITNVYELGDRVSNDIDVLVNEKNVGRCKELLYEYGFKQGYIEKGVFREATRTEIIMSKMNFGETIPFCKEVKGRFIIVDINFSLDYKPMQDDGIITKMLKRCITLPIEKTKLTTLCLPDFIIHLCLHLYKEATTLDWVERRKDLNLYKFNDIYTLFYGKADSELFDSIVSTIREYGVEKECYYAFLHTLDIYKILDDIKGYSDMLDRIRPSNLEYLNQIVSPKEKKVYMYNMDFLDWIICENRVSCLKEVESDI